MKPALVILAAGMGSRYGGLKQMDPVDPYGNLIIDYSIYDAARAGFERAVCVIKKEMEHDFNEAIGRRISRHIELVLAYQEIDMLPPGYTVPEGRTKPWGTAHALLCAQNAVSGPFAVINADDYYGQSAYSVVYEYLCSPRPAGSYAMVGYPLENTLTEYGTVARGICNVDDNGYLVHIQEYLGISRHKEGGVAEVNGERVILPAGSIASMNLWGFGMDFFQALETNFPVFLSEEAPSTPLKAEYMLPNVVQRLLDQGKATVRVFTSNDPWFGVTYRQDMPAVRAALDALKRQGVYSERLWG